jgi:CO/xanthine dehydrogenase Mo-binding subunit
VADPEGAADVDERNGCYLIVPKQRNGSAGPNASDATDVAAAAWRLPATKTSAPIYLAVAMEIEVDRDTGNISVRRAVAATDYGQPVNPSGTRNQIEGGSSNR